ncbi:MAG: TonB-dependent receptor [Bacteroidota bacterium]
MSLPVFIFRPLCVGIGLLLVSTVYGQKNEIFQTLRGTIVDQATQQALVGASVQLLDVDSPLGAISDDDGNFVIERVPVGRYEVRIKYIGYQSQLKSGILLTSGQETILDIGMIEQAIQGEAISIEANQRLVTNEAALVSARSFSVEELRRIPGGVDDPARTAVKFPGISPNGSVLSNELNVRGNGSRAVIWRLEGVDIYNPNHFGVLGGTGGSITLFSQQLLANTDFFSGAFPADYGNALGGVFDARFRNGNTQKRQHTIQLGFLGVDLATEGPFTKSGKNSYLANYRYSTTGIINQFINLGSVPTFQDLSFKLHFELPNSGTLNVFGIGGISLIEFGPVLDTARWDEEPGANFVSYTRSVTGTAGLTYSQAVSSKSYFQTAVIATGMNSFQERFYQNRDLVTADTTQKADDYEYRFSWSSYFNHKFGSRHSHRSGLMVHGLMADVLFVRAENLDPDNTGAFTDTVRQGSGQSMLLEGYSRSQFVLNSQWQLNAGLHLMYLAFTGELSLEPRLGIRYQINPRQSLSLGYGLHSQMEPFFTYVVQRRNAQGNLYRYNDQLLFNKAHHLVLSYRWQANERLRLGIEAYHQSQFNLIVGTDLPVSRVGGSDFAFETLDLNNGGTGRNTGVEFALERIFADGYYFLVNGSVFDATYTANDQVTRPSQYNAGVVGNAIVGKEWKLGKKKGKANLFNANVSATYSGAQYFTPIDLPTAIEKGRFQTDYNNPNSLKQDPLLYLDASIVYQVNRRNRSSQLSLQIRNLLNQRPLLSQSFDRENGEADNFYGSGLLPILAWRIQF